jgi:hypothetical protein
MAEDNTGWIARCTDRSKLRQCMKNTKDRQRMDIYWQAFRRLCDLDGLNFDDPLEREFYSTLAAYEELLREKNGRTTRAARTRQKLGRKGVIQCLEDWATANAPTEGFRLLIDAGLIELTGEHLVLKYPSNFSDEAKQRARHRLEEAGWNGG